MIGWERYRRALSATIASIAIVFPIANLLVVASGFGARPGLEIPVWSPAMDDELFRVGGAYRFEPRWLWEPNPGAMVFSDVINERSCRGPVVPFERGTKRRILVIGDSQPFGHGVRDADSWPRRLEAMLAAEGHPVEVINASCPGHTIVLGLARFLLDTSRYDAEVVVLSFGVGNEGARPAGGHSDVALLGALRDRGGGMERLTRRISIVRAISSAIGRFVPEPIAPGSASFRVSPLEVMHSAGAFFRAVELHTSGTTLLVSPLRQKTFATSGSELDSIDDALSNAASTHGVRIVDLRATFAPTKLDATAAFRDPLHFTPDGHEVVARAIAAAILESGALTPK